MEDTKEFTKEKLKPVTSRTTASRQTLSAKQSTADGAKPPTVAKYVTKEAEKMRDLLARMKDVTHNWPSRQAGGTLPAPFITPEFIFFAFPLGGHVIQNAVTSDGKQNFLVDGVLVIPVTSEEK